MATTRDKGLEAAELQELHDLALEHLFVPLVPRAQLATPGGLEIYVEGEGCRVTDADGKSYIDAFAGLMTRAIGYGRKEIADAVYAQMLKLSAPPGASGTTVPTIRLAAKLAQITPGSLSKSFFTTGGNESIETAVKMARHYQRLSGFGNRYKIIAREHEYHGQSFLAMALGKHSAAMFAPYEPLVPGIRHVAQPYCYRCPLRLEYPDCGVACAKELERVIQFEGPEMVAAFIATTVCQNAPVVVPPPDYWPTIRAICDKYGVLLICDEVVDGFGRTGKMFAVEHWGLVPDMMALAKGIASGYLPLGACIATSEVSKKFDEALFIHLITYGCGTPAPCAAALANIEIIERERLPERAAAMGEYFSKKAEALYEHPTVGEIAGIGLLWNIELVKDKKSKERFGPAADALTVRKLREAGLITRVDGGAIRFTPPLIITEDEIDESIAIMDKVIGQMEKELSAG